MTSKPDLMTTDLDLAFHDFAHAFTTTPDEALAAFQLLLLRRDLCRARVAFLRRLSYGAAKPGNFEQEVALIRDPGTLVAVEQGTLSLARLASLSCHPDALWQAHLAATDSEAPAPPPGGDSEVLLGTSFTTLARTDRLDELRERLRPLLPFLLEHRGLPAALAGDFLDFVVSQVPRMGPRRFRDVLPDWLQEFARARGLTVAATSFTDEDFRALTGRSAVARVLDRVGASEPDWARNYRTFARSHILRTPGELRSLEAPAALADEPDLPIFRRGLAAEAERVQQEDLTWLLE
jgi:hypothetical protein